MDDTFFLGERLAALDLALPRAAPPAANYVPWVVTGGHLYIAGQIPFLNGEAMHRGRLGDTLDLEGGIAAAQACALNILAQADAAVNGDWRRITRCVKLGAFVNCTPDFTDHAKVANGASDLMVAVMGAAGKHVRFAVGAPSLPLDAAVEIETLFALDDLS